MEDRKLRIAAVGDELLAGLGDPRALGWLGRVLARTPQDGMALESYALPCPQEGTEGLAARWLEEAGRRFSDNHENRLVIGLSGRLYYDLLSTRQKTEDKTTAIVRVEQLYPLPAAEIAAELAKYPNAEVVWAQDEPANQGPWPFIGLNLPDALDRRVRLVSRPASASTAAGSMKRHAAEQDALLKQAFARK